MENTEAALWGCGVASLRGPGEGKGGARERPGRPGGTPEAVGLNRDSGNPRRRRPARTPVELEVEDDYTDWFAKTEKFRGLIVN